MSITLRPGISFCHVGDRTIFLDVVADRYFCLNASAEAAFNRAVVAESAQNLEDAEINDLLRRGLLVSGGPTARSKPCTSANAPRTSLLDQMTGSAALGEAGAATFHILRTRLALRHYGFAGCLNALAAQLAALARDGATLEPNEAIEQSRRLIGAFVRAGRLTGTLDDCLVQSLAVASALAARGITSETRIGVRLGPFAAHCWVQSNGCLVNDRFDVVRCFTPILVIP